MSTRLSLDALIDRLAGARHPVLLMHTRPDGDTAGSTAALWHLLTAMGKPVSYACPDPMYRRLQFLFEGCESAPLPRPEEGTVITVDVASRAQLGTLADRPDIGAPACMIDHHERGELFADCYADPSAAATGEIILRIARRMTERGLIASIPEGAIHAIYAAISSDTGCFRYANVTPDTHLAAAELLRAGADAADINHRLFDTKSRTLMQAESMVQSGMEVFCGGHAALFVLSREQMQKAGLTEEDFDTAVDVVRTLEGVVIAAVAKETSVAGIYKISLRSTGPDVGSIAAAQGGGGHRLAAGYTLRSNCPQQVAQSVRHLLSEALTPLDKAPVS